MGNLCGKSAVSKSEEAMQEVELGCQLMIRKDAERMRLHLIDIGNNEQNIEITLERFAQGKETEEATTVLTTVLDASNRDLRIKLDQLKTSIRNCHQRIQRARDFHATAENTQHIKKVNTAFQRLNQGKHAMLDDAQDAREDMRDHLDEMKEVTDVVQQMGEAEAHEGSRAEHVEDAEKAMKMRIQKVKELQALKLNGDLPEARAVKFSIGLEPPALKGGFDTEEDIEVQELTQVHLNANDETA